MSSIRTKMIVFLTLAIGLPALIVSFCFEDVVRMHDNETAFEQIKDVEGFLQRNEKWTDSELKTAQQLRARLTYLDLQTTFSSWIQARSEESDHLIKMRTTELRDFLQNRYSVMKSQNSFLLQKITYMLWGMGAFLFLFVVGAYQFVKRNIFARINHLTQEIGHFRVMEFEPRFYPSSSHDEIEDLFVAFRALVDNLYHDLHEDLQLGSVKDSHQGPHAVEPIKEQVQKYLIERRINRDRRERDAQVENERRTSEDRRRSG